MIYCKFTTAEYASKSFDNRSLFGEVMRKLGGLIFWTTLHMYTWTPEGIDIRSRAPLENATVLKLKVKAE